MKVRCEASNAGSDIRCRVCGQGFLIHWAGESAEQQAAFRALLLQELRAHHGDSSSPAAHPQGIFSLRESSTGNGGLPAFVEAFTLAAA